MQVKRPAQCEDIGRLTKCLHSHSWNCALTDNHQKDPLLPLVQLPLRCLTLNRCFSGGNLLIQQLKLIDECDDIIKTFFNALLSYQCDVL